MQVNTCKQLPVNCSEMKNARNISESELTELGRGVGATSSCSTLEEAQPMAKLHKHLF